MKTSKTRSVGNRTARTRRSFNLNISNLDPNMDYSFRKKSDIEQGGGQDMHGYTPVNASTSVGESWEIPVNGVRTKGKKQLVMQDVILCKRPKEVSQYFQDIEDEKYNSQINLVNSVGKGVGQKAREAGITITDSSTGLNEPQRLGPSEGMDLINEEEGET